MSIFLEDSELKSAWIHSSEQLKAGCSFQRVMSVAYPIQDLAFNSQHFRLLWLSRQCTSIVCYYFLMVSISYQDKNLTQSDLFPNHVQCDSITVCLLCITESTIRKPRVLTLLILGSANHSLSKPTYLWWFGKQTLQSCQEKKKVLQWEDKSCLKVYNFEVRCVGSKILQKY